MNKNPFVPQPSYQHQQPPLPPGPPPPQPAAQPDYSAYWSAQQAAAQPTFNPQWAAQNPQWPGAPTAQTAAPAKPPGDQAAALYANYGYGQQWQQHQQHYAQPTATPPVIAAQPYHHPYQQPATPYAAQPYPPQPMPPPQTPAQPAFRPPQAPQTQQTFYQHQQRPPPSAMIQNSPSQQMPPAKRQRFDNSHQSTPQQPRFQQPSSSQGMQGIPLGPSKPSSLPQQPSQMPSQGSFAGGAGRGGMSGGRGSGMNRGGRGGNNSGNRGMGMNRGRVGGMHSGSGRGGGTNQSNGSLRGHQSRERNNFSNFNRRGGGSFNSPHHQNNSSFRSGHGGRSNNNQSHNRSGRNDNFHHNRASTNTTSGSGGGSGKREENRRTLTDFKIIGLEIASLGWKWGQIPADSDSETTKSTEDAPKSETSDVESTDVDTKENVDELNKPLSAPKDGATSGTSAARMRIYFHTPPSADDSRPIIPSPSVSDTRKGKRKKLDDDDGDAGDEIRAPPPPPVPSGKESVDGSTGFTGDDQDGNIGRGSDAPSVEETPSEADWLMAAIAEGDGEMESEACEQTQIDTDVEVNDQDGKLYLAVGQAAGRRGQDKKKPLFFLSTKLIRIFSLFFLPKVLLNWMMLFRNLGLSKPKLLILSWILRVLKMRKKTLNLLP